MDPRPATINVSQFEKRIQASLSEVHYSEKLIKILFIFLNRDLHGVNHILLQ